MVPARKCVALAVALVTLPACAVNGLSFSKDDRVTITAPRESDRVELPLEVSWEVEDFDGTFAVFFDRTPMRANQTVLSLVDEDDPCRRRGQCPDDDWLRDRHIYITTETSVRVEALPDLRDNDRSPDRHQVTIVLLDTAGRRIGESAFFNDFIVERAD